MGETKDVEAVLCPAQDNPSLHYKQQRCVFTHSWVKKRKLSNFIISSTPNISTTVTLLIKDVIKS
jgi:hypothetical protein